MSKNVESLKEMDAEINKVKNRIRKLQKKSQSETNSSNHHDILKKEILKRKIIMAQSLLDDQQQIDEQNRIKQQKLRILKQRNFRRRSQQKQQLSNVMKAIYFVKADDARQARKISQAHKNKIKQLQNQSNEENRLKRERVRSQSGKVQKFWKDKIYKVYFDNYAQKMMNEKALNNKQKQLTQLIKEENILHEEFEKNHFSYEKSKKQHLGMMALPPRQVASVLELHQRNKEKQQTLERINSGGSMSKRAKAFDEFQIPEQDFHIIPKTQVNEAKLKIVLERLRRKQK